MGVYNIEEGEVFIDGVSVRKTNTNWPSVSINVDKVVAFYFYNGEDGEQSDCKIITDNHVFTVVGYGKDKVGAHGLGWHICDNLKAYIDAPVGVNYRHDDDVFTDDEIHVSTYNEN